MLLAICILVGLNVVLSFLLVVLVTGFSRTRKAVDWLQNFADEGLALAKHAKAAHLSNKQAFSARDEEEEAVRWVVERAASVKVKCTRAQAAKLVAIRRSS
jgi:hypothetical protein